MITKKTQKTKNTEKHRKTHDIHVRTA
jgi:hypothetical protein